MCLCVYLTILGLTVTVTKELSYPVEQKAKSINLRGTLPPPPSPQTRGVLLPWLALGWTELEIFKFNLNTDS